MGTMLLTLMLGFPALLLTRRFWQRVEALETGRARRWFVGWTLKGVALPIVAWVLMNGFSPLVPLGNPAPGVPPAKAFLLLQSAGAAGLIVLPVWAAVNFAWIGIDILRSAKCRRGLFFVAGIWGVLMSPVCVVVVVLFGWAGIGLAAALWLGPMTNALLNERPPARSAPSYSRALGRLQFGHLNDAEWEIIRELEQCENDFDGWMLLAELYARHYGDLAAAEETVLDLCLQPGLHPSRVGVALNRLADWHLELGDNPVAARRTLEALCVQFAGTHMAQMALQRLARLPACREELLEERAGRRIRLPALRAGDEAAAPADAAHAVRRREAVGRANRLADRLRDDPNHVAAREEFARILAEDLGRAEDGIQQVELLLALPEASPEKAAGWLGLLAGWHLRLRGDEAAGRRLLERLVREHAKSPEAFAAERRLKMLDMEAKLRSAGAARAKGG